MSLRIIKPSTGDRSTEEGLQPPPPEPGDEWGTRIAKLIPAEALGLFGTAVALVPETPYRVAALYVIVALCIVVTILVRYRSTRSEQGGSAQKVAIAISVISFLIWLTALPVSSPQITPFQLSPDIAFAGPLAALLWGTLVPYFYHGD